MGSMLSSHKSNIYYNVNKLFHMIRMPYHSFLMRCNYTLLKETSFQKMKGGTNIKKDNIVNAYDLQHCNDSYMTFIADTSE